MSVTIAAPTSEVVAAYFGSAWATKNSAIIKPEVRKTLYEKYGKGIGMADFIRMKGSVEDVPNQTITILQKESPIATVTTSGEISTNSAGEAITFKIATTDYDTGYKHPLVTGTDILIPAAYQYSGCRIPRAYRIMSSSGSTNDLTFTAEPYAEAATYVTDSIIATAVPDGTELVLGANSFATGTDQPKGLTDDFTSMTFKPRLLKTSADIEGGQISQSFYEASGMEGVKGVLFAAEMQMEFDLDVKESRAFSFGEWNDNSALVETAESGLTTQSIISGGGLWPHADKYAQVKSYSGSFVIDDLHDVKMLKEAQGQVGTENLFILGPSLAVDVYKACKDEIKEFSGGTDLLDKAKNELGVDINAVRVNGQTYYFLEPAEMKDPTGVGLNINGTYSYEYATMGLIVPNNKSTVTRNGRANVTMDNVVLGYVNHNGENRRRVVGYKWGMNGLGVTNVASSYDGLHTYMMAHMTPMFCTPNQWVLVHKAS